MTVVPVRSKPNVLDMTRTGTCLVNFSRTFAFLESNSVVEP